MSSHPSIAHVAMEGQTRATRNGGRPRLGAQKVSEKRPRAPVSRLVEEFLRRRDLEHLALVHEDHPVGDLACETHQTRGYVTELRSCVSRA